MKMLAVKNVVDMNEAVIAATSPKETSFLRSPTLLDAALQAPLQTFDGVELFPTPTSKIARATWGIVKNHPFENGNKRTGALALLFLLDWNNIKTAHLPLADWFSSIARGSLSCEEFIVELDKAVLSNPSTEAVENSDISLTLAVLIEQYKADFVALAEN